MRPTREALTRGGGSSLTIVAVFVVLTALLAPTVAPPGAPFGPPPAEAAEVRAGKRAGQIDILLGNQTRRVARDWWAGLVACRDVAIGAGGVGLAGGPKGAVGAVLVGSTACMSVVATCAARAAVRGRWAGMTIGFHGYSCWSY